MQGNTNVFSPRVDRMISNQSLCLLSTDTLFVDYEQINVNVTSFVVTSLGLRMCRRSE